MKSTFDSLTTVHNAVIISAIIIHVTVLCLFGVQGLYNSISIQLSRTLWVLVLLIVPIKSTFDQLTTVHYSAVISAIIIQVYF